MTMISLSRILDHWAKIQPDRPAVVIGDEVATWSEMERSTNRLARAYQSLGVSEGDFVTIALPNSIEFLKACFATWKLGATPQPVSSRLPRAERDAIIELANPALVVGVEGLAGHWASVPTGFEPDADCSGEPLEERTSKNIKAVTSGGSTGRPKLIVQPIPAIWDTDFTFVTIPHESTVLVPGPMYHNGPFVWSTCAMFQGSTVVLCERFDAEQTLELIDRHRVENLYAVPTMMQRIWVLPEETRNQYDLSSLTCLTHMAAPCPAWLKEAFIEWLGPNVIWEVYSGSEGQGSTLISGEEWLQHRGSVGRPMDYCEMRIVDQEGRDLPPGEIGEIYMRPETGEGSTYEYIGAKSKKLEGGWESLGDMGYMDEDGYLYLADRRTDLIICGGANIYPAEVEAAIDSYPGVRSSAVIGLPHKDLGNAVHAIIDAPGEGIGDEELLSHLEQQLVRYKLPRSFEYVSEPLRDDAGKVRRKALREARVN